MLSTLVRPAPKASITWSPYDPRWYHDIASIRSDAGPVILPDAALSIAVVYRAVNVLAHAIASIPLIVYRRLENDGKERAPEHPQYDLLHDRPNGWMTSFQWRHLLMVQSILWGNHYSQIVPGAGAIGQLVPLNPDTTRIVDQLADGRLVYVTRTLTARGYGPEQRLLQDEVFHVRGFTIDGKSGLPLHRLARQAMGLALTAERHGSLFLRRGARFAGFLTTDRHIDAKHREELEESWARQYAGVEGSGKIPLLTSGIKFESLSANNRDSQWLEARQFQVEELLRFIGVPGVLVGYPDKTATYASAEQFFLSFVTHSVRPWAENIAAELNATVVTGAPEFFAEFKLEGLLKGDIQTRYIAHQLAIQSGWKTRNEVRIEENYNRGPAELDEFIQPLNFGAAGAQATATTGQEPDDADDNRDDDGSRTTRRTETEARIMALRSIAERSVARLVRREFAAIQGSGRKKGAAARFAGNEAGWREWLSSFYNEQCELIMQDLGVDRATARRYCDMQIARFTILSRVGADAERESVALLAQLLPDLTTERVA